MSEVSQDLLMLVKPELPESFSALLKVLRLHEEEEGTHFTFTKCTAYVCKVLSISLSKQTSVTPCKAKFHILLITSFLVGVQRAKERRLGSQDWTLDCLVRPEEGCLADDSYRRNASESLKEKAQQINLG